MTDEKKVKAKYPDAVAIWTSRGWRIHFDDGTRIIGRTQSAHVPEEEAWADAAKRIEASHVF